MRLIPKRVSELIGGVRRRIVMRWRDAWSSYEMRDLTQADYQFWDKARRARAEGLEISGLLLKPLGSKVSAWVLGQKPGWKSGDKADAKTADALTGWWNAHHADILRAYEEALNLGDCYLVVNGDLSITIVPPHVVDPMVDENDFSRIIGWRITERYPHPTDVGRSMTIIDEYTAQNRKRRVLVNGVQTFAKTYANFIGRVPVIHIANRFGVDELFGRPEGEALIPALQKYGDIIEAGIKGNIRQGRPTPVIQKMGTPQDVQKFWELYGEPERHEKPDGTIEEVIVIPFDSDELLTIGGTGEFTYAQPGSFIGDTEKLLGLLFYLVLQHSEIPEFVWGNAISSSHASAEAQLPPFVKWLEKKRGLAEGWINELARVVVSIMALYDVSVNADAELLVQWQALTEDDGRLRLDAVVWAHGQGLITDETANRLIPGFNFDDPAGEARKGRREQEQRRAAFDQSAEAQIDALADTPDDEAPPEAEKNAA